MPAWGVVGVPSASRLAPEAGGVPRFVTWAVYVPEPGSHCVRADVRGVRKRPCVATAPVRL